MQRVTGIIVVMGLVMTAAPCWADDMASGPVRKLGRGLSNLAFGVWELPIAIKETNDVDGTVAVTTLGVVAGMAAVFRRMTVGLYETVTFPFPNPLVNYDPLIQPEFLRLASEPRV